MADWDDNPFTRAAGQSAEAPPPTSRPGPPPRPSAPPAADEPAWAKPREAPSAQPAAASWQQPTPEVQAAPAVDNAAIAADEARRQQEHEARIYAAEKLKIERSAVSVIEGRPVNFPRFPKGCPTPFKPCFHINMKGEIPPSHRRNIRLMWYLWYFTCFCLLFNFIGNLASLQYYGSGVPTSTGLSSLWLVMFVACSFCCWFHCIYTAFRTGSNFRYGWFFFVSMFQLIFSALMAVGVPYTGGAGFLLAALMFGNKNNAAATVVVLSGTLWVLHFLATLWLSKRILSAYRSEGGSIAKMRSDFSQESKSGIVKMATTEVATTAAVTAANQQWGQPPK